MLQGCLECCHAVVPCTAGMRHIMQRPWQQVCLEGMQSLLQQDHAWRCQAVWRPAAAITVTRTFGAACSCPAGLHKLAEQQDQSHLTLPCQKQLSLLPSIPAMQLWLHRWYLAGRSAVLRRALCLSDSAALEGRPAAQWLGQGRQQAAGTEGISTDHPPSQVSDPSSDLRLPWLHPIACWSQ